jgi:aminopeptidase-like protein
MNYPMIKWAKDLFPLCRSITGEGVKKTLEYFIKVNPEFRIINFKSGLNVFDWKIPQVWNIKDAYIEHESGKKYAQFSKLNLHVVGYSVPINKIISKKDLLKHIYTQKDQPNSVPYVTSYYKKRWGFCLSENEKRKLPKGKYRVFIDSNFKNGNLKVAQAVIKGSSKKEIFFSSYICHPSMANNELSGPVLLNAIMKYVKRKKRNFTYRFVLLPETIGSIAYLSKYKNIMKKNIICGYNLTCVGDDRAYSYVASRDGNTIADYFLDKNLKNVKNFKKYHYTGRGSDERQYCSPGIDLPVCAFSRSKSYKEYHTNKDDFKVVTQKGLVQSFKLMKKIINQIENSTFPKVKIFCEPNLGKRNLYPTLSKKGSYNNIKIRMDLLAYADGSKSLDFISSLIKKPINKLTAEYKLLKSKGLLI